MRLRWCAAGLFAMQLLAACGGGSNAVEPPAKTAPPATPSHGFDPRGYYKRPALFVRSGAASYYADSFTGRKTANGERYDPRAFTAAHRSLPFGTILRVVSVKTGDWVLVRVNDRGPYGPRKRIVDLSREAARRLSILREGVARVRVEVLELGSGKRSR
jgi:rare lipoprotein A